MRFSNRRISNIITESVNTVINEGYYDRVPLSTIREILDSLNGQYEKIGGDMSLTNLYDDFMHRFENLGYGLDLAEENDMCDDEYTDYNINFDKRCNDNKRRNRIGNEMNSDYTKYENPSQKFRQSKEDYMDNWDNADAYNRMSEKDKDYLYLLKKLGNEVSPSSFMSKR